MKPYLSIIIPIYNINEHFLRKCIESAMRQTLKELEIILINDGSTNNNKSICEEYAVSDSRISIVNQDNKGVSVARNKGIELSKADWIMFLDADDYLSENICEKAYSKAIEYNADIVQFAFSYKSEDNIDDTKNENFGDGREVFMPATEYRLKFIENVVHANNSLKPMYLSVPWGKLFKKSLITNNNLAFVPGLARMQDMIFNAYVFQFTKNLLYIDDIGYYYNRTNDSVTVKYNPNSVDTFKSVYTNLLLFLKQYYPDKQYSYLKLSIGYASLVDSLRLQILHKDNNTTLSTKYKNVKKLLNDPIYSHLFTDTTMDFIRRKRKLYYLLYYKLYSLIILFKNKL